MAERGPPNLLAFYFSFFASSESFSLRSKILSRSVRVFMATSGSMTLIFPKILLDTKLPIVESSSIIRSLTLFVLSVFCLGLSSDDGSTFFSALAANKLESSLFAFL